MAEVEDAISIVNACFDPIAQEISKKVNK